MIENPPTYRLQIVWAAAVAVTVPSTEAIQELLVQLSYDSPWYESNEVIGAVLSAVVGAVLATTLAFLINRGKQRVLRKIQDKLRTANVEITTLKQRAERYAGVQAKLRASTVVCDYEQPVLLLGPRNVGKSSLMMQWHAPWDGSILRPTTTEKWSSVPVYDFVRAGSFPHFADDEVLTKVHAHLKLKVHDFPGDASIQRRIIKVAQQETDRLRRELRLNLGVVLVCMVDAREAAKKDGIDRDTMEYFNGDLFQNLRRMVADNSIDIQRLVVVFNKFDLLKNKEPNTPDMDLLKLCCDNFYDNFDEFVRMCDSEKRYEAITVLDRDSRVTQRGATVVLGEAARGLVGAAATVAEASDAQRLRQLIDDNPEFLYQTRRARAAIPEPR